LPVFPAKAARYYNETQFAGAGGAVGVKGGFQVARSESRLYGTDACSYPRIALERSGALII
jgi:hypothetical protein